MRDLLGWNLSLGRWAGIHIRVHVFFIVLAIVAIHLATVSDAQGELVVDVAVSLVVLFVSVLAHELGHCFAARRMGGRADQVVLWPLGGLVMINLSHQPQEEFVTAAAGPLVNFAICVVSSLPLLFTDQNMAALLNPLAAPAALNGITWVYVLQLTVWINWLLILVNLLPAYPLDGGRVLRSVIWHRKGYRTSVVMVARVAKITALGTWVAAWLVHPHYAHASLPLLVLGLLLFFSAKQESERLQDREAEEGVFGYDFSQGYTSLERSASPLRKSPGIVRQWLDNRREARRVRQAKTEEEDDRRVDEVLARLHEVGRDGLSEDDRALLDRVSARYRNRQRG